jgi:hypothetical protein
VAEDALRDRGFGDEGDDLQPAAAGAGEDVLLCPSQTDHRLEIPAGQDYGQLPRFTLDSV